MKHSQALMPVFLVALLVAGCGTFSIQKRSVSVVKDISGVGPAKFVKVAFASDAEIEGFVDKGAIQFRAYLETEDGQPQPFESTVEIGRIERVSGDGSSPGPKTDETYLYQALVFRGLKHQKTYNFPHEYFDLSRQGYSIRCRVEVWSKPFPVAKSSSFRITSGEIQDALKQPEGELNHYEVVN